MTYRRRASPLHAARAAVGSLWCLAIGAAALTSDHPLVLAVLLATVIAAAFAARVGREVLRVALWALPFALVVALINPIVTREGLTILLRGGTVPVLGQLDITLEATVMGGVLGLQALVVIVAFGLHSCAVDPDDLLRGFRRVSMRSALSAALATRMVPVLARDGRRMADAQRCRAGEPASRLDLVRAVSANALDRALDVAATLEVRGYGSLRRPPATRRPWSRHDVAFALSAAAIVAVTVTGDAPFDAYPRMTGSLDAGVVVTSALLCAAALLPFADRRGTGT